MEDGLPCRDSGGREGGQKRKRPRQLEDGLLAGAALRETEDRCDEEFGEVLSVTEENIGFNFIY